MSNILLKLFPAGFFFTCNSVGGVKCFYVYFEVSSNVLFFTYSLILSIVPFKKLQIFFFHINWIKLSKCLFSFTGIQTQKLKFPTRKFKIRPWIRLKFPVFIGSGSAFQLSTTTTRKKRQKSPLCSKLCFLFWFAV